MLPGARRLVSSLVQGTPRRLFSRAQASLSRPRPQRNHVLILSSATVAAGSLWYATEKIHNDAEPESEEEFRSDPKPGAKGPMDASAGITLSGPEVPLSTLAWGSNKSHLLSNDGQARDSVHAPEEVAWLKDVALRDLALHERHAACVDARGDVYQWGDGFFDTSDAARASPSAGMPLLTLRGKNIVCLQATPDRVFALSGSGKIYVLPAAASRRYLPISAPPPAGSPWWSTRWLWGEDENVDYGEIVPNEKLSWGEKFVSIAAGNDHLLGMTNSGRTFAHPINLKANAYGQLGFRSFDIPDPSQPGERKHIELIPKAVSDPFAMSGRALRPASPELTAGMDDKSIRFSDKLFEVPALKGVHADKIAAGGRTSFVLTGGKVLGWGANEYGQIGLGGSVTLDTITIPTEVNLWRATPQSMRTRCLDVYAGGDLTIFVVERVDGSSLPYIDVLACGNGQWGGLGNAQYSNAQGSPVRARNVSGLLEYSEKDNNLQAIVPYDISISPTGHVLLILDTLQRAGPGGQGRDLVGWGANYDRQLGNGRRASAASPMALSTPDGERFILGKKTADVVRDLQGNVWKKNVDVEQRAVAGYGNSVVYWNICS